MAKNWVQDAGTTLSYTDQALGSADYNNKIADTTNMHDDNLVTYGYHGTASPPSVGTIVVTFAKPLFINKVVMKWTVSRDAGGGTSSGLQDISLYYGAAWHSVWDDNEQASGPNTTEVTGAWEAVEKIQFTVYVTAASLNPVAAAVTFYEAQAFGYLRNYGIIV